MSRSRKDIIETENMLQRLRALLMRARDVTDMAPGQPDARADAEALRKISMTLRRWHELECNEDVVRGKYERVAGVKTFAECEDGKTYIRRRLSFSHRDTFIAIPDRETGARKRLAKIMARYPGLTAYVQGDPRGCALYILKPGDVPAGEDVSCYYSRGLAVFQ